ncbi:ATP-binding cassette domain-containing protein [Mycetocola manganoxydans]|uniref:ATP-binding cassette domain-containing protein n=1 Tax=Mycetocola manganoxydans TaxID=699879 RepID=A0A3L6ZUR0_9MICO|nr:ATP-binding cassette domain-containing protein [Mycetocola manganoxydans]RLP71637.1 ATP-binding cassette domain-containing protein [Mycetocola manganoxydans]GHD38799.1 ABC transporter ATP-binding protein [Mycetocola manganoxydans]
MTDRLGSGSVPGASIRARDWGWRHAGRGKPAVSALDLDIEPGERVLLLGASGAGKSTLMQAMAGVLGGDEEGDESGTLLLDGRRPADARGRAGLVLQDPDSQIVLARIGDDVAFAPENLGVPREEIWRRVRWALSAVGLDLPLHHSSSDLSGGQKQRLALASVLAMQPGLLLLDEPTANLDPDGVREIRDTVDRVVANTGATLVVVEHRVAVWRDIVDRVVVLDPSGGVLADGSPHAVLEREGPRLAAAGVWVPGIPPRVADRPHRRATGADLLVASDLAVGRTPFASKQPFVAASAIDVTLAEGTGLALTGPNGAGKSTLALTLAGLLEPVDGSLRATRPLARGLSGSPFRWKSRDLLTRLGTVFQDPEHQFLAATVRRELAIGPHALKLPQRDVDARVDELLQRLRLDHLADANPFTLSGGEKRRLSVATVLAARPQVLLLDEPTFGQDAVTWGELVSLLGELVDEGRSVVTVTHDRALVTTFADRELALGTTSGVPA